MAISMLKIRRPLGRLIFNMGIAIPGKTVFLIEMAPRLLYACMHVYASVKDIFVEYINRDHVNDIYNLKIFVE